MGRDGAVFTVGREVPLCEHLNAQEENLSGRGAKLRFDCIYIHQEPKSTDCSRRTRRTVVGRGDVGRSEASGVALAGSAPDGSEVLFSTLLWF
jgi:hypothetical protein